MFRFDEFLEQTCSFIMAFSFAEFSNALSGKKDNPKKDFRLTPYILDDCFINRY